MSNHNLEEMIRRETARRMGKKTLTSTRKQSSAFSSITDVSASEQTVRTLLSESMVGLVRHMKSGLHRPTSGQIHDIVHGFQSNMKIPVDRRFDQDAKDDNIVHDRMVKIMLLNLIQSILSQEKKEKKENKEVSPQLMEHIYKELRSSTTVTKSGKRIPSDSIDPAVWERYVTRRMAQRGGMVPSMPAATTSFFSGTQTAPIEHLSTQQPVNSSYQEYESNNDEVKNETVVSTPYVIPTNMQRVASSTMPNNLSRIVSYENQASKMIQNKKVALGNRPIKSAQRTYLSLSDGIYQWTGVSLYNPFSTFEPLVSKSMKQKFGFIRQQMDHLKTKLAIHSSDRFGVLQYNSIVNILQSIRIGSTKLVDELPDSKVRYRIHVQAPGDVHHVMTALANYDRRFEDIYLYVQRKTPSTTQKIQSFFGVESNYVIEKIMVLFTDTTKEAGKNQYYLSFDPIQLDRDFKPWAARFMMPNAGNIEQVMEAIDGVLKLEVSFIGFWHPSTSTATIIASLKGTNEITNKIISDMGKFSELAFQLTQMRMRDFLIGGLHRVVQDPSKAVEVRLQSYQLQDAISTLAASKQEWDVTTVEQLVDLATNMAVTSGQLDQTLKDDQAVIDFFKNTTAKFGNALKQSIDSVADVAEFFGGSINRFTKAANQISKSILREEIIFMYLTFFIYYLTMGSCTMKLLAWAAPLLNPIAPVIAMEQVAESTLGIQPNKGLTLLMLYLFYRIWDKEKVAPITNTVMEFFTMCRFKSRDVPISAAEYREMTAPVEVPVVAPMVAPRTPRSSRPHRGWNIAPPQQQAARVAERLQQRLTPQQLQQSRIQQQIENAHDKLRRNGIIKGGNRTRKNRRTTRK